MIKFRMPLLAVRDVEISKKFYHDLFDQEVVLDLGGNVTFSGGFSVQQDFDRLTGVPKSTILHQSHNMELYFEVDDFDAFTEKLRGHLDVELVHPPMTHAWQQRVVRLYDPDWHMIEVGESMEHIALRLLDEGRSVEETAALILRCRPRKAARAAARQRREQLVLERPETRADPLLPRYCGGQPRARCLRERRARPVV